MSGCSQTAPPNVALTEEPQEEAIEGAKAIFATGEGPSFLASAKKTASVKSERKKLAKAEREQYMQGCSILSDSFIAENISYIDTIIIKFIRDIF